MLEKQSLETKEEYINDFDVDISEEKNGLSHKLEHFLESRYFVAVVVVLVATIAFCIGRFGQIGSMREPVRILRSGQAGAVANLEGSVSNKDIPPNPPYPKGSTEEKNTESQNFNAAASGSQQVVASKNGTKYHLPTCPGAKQISEKNKITFKSIEEARAAGYTPAANCKGLK